MTSKAIQLPKQFYYRLEQAAHELEHPGGAQYLLHLGSTLRADICVWAGDWTCKPIQTRTSMAASSEKKVTREEYRYLAVLEETDCTRIECFGSAKINSLAGWAEDEPDLNSRLELEEHRTITIDNLLITKDELERLKNGGKHIPRQFKAATPHGNSLNNARIREEILLAAIACYYKAENKPTTIKHWMNLIELDAKTFWPVTKTPPRDRRTIQVLLGRALKMEKAKDSPK